MTFANPDILWGLLILVPYVAWYIWKRGRLHASVAVSSLVPFAKARTSFVRPYAMFFVRLAAIAALIVVLARPQTRDRWSSTSTEGTDIVIALDLSTSMLARDFKPDRFEAAKQVAAQFVAGRRTGDFCR